MVYMSFFASLQLIKSKYHSEANDRDGYEFVFLERLCGQDDQYPLYLGVLLLTTQHIFKAYVPCLERMLVSWVVKLPGFDSMENSHLGRPLAEVGSLLMFRRPWQSWSRRYHCLFEQGVGNGRRKPMMLGIFLAITQGTENLRVNNITNHQQRTITTLFISIPS